MLPYETEREIFSRLPREEERRVRRALSHFHAQDAEELAAEDVMSKPITEREIEWYIRTYIPSVFYLCFTVDERNLIRDTYMIGNWTYAARGSRLRVLDELFYTRGYSGELSGSIPKTTTIAVPLADVIENVRKEITFNKSSSMDAKLSCNLTATYYIFRERLLRFDISPHYAKEKVKEMLSRVLDYSEERRFVFLDAELIAMNLARKYPVTKSKVNEVDLDKLYSQVEKYITLLLD